MCCPCRHASILGSEATVVGCDTYCIPTGLLKERDVIALGHDARGEVISYQHVHLPRPDQHTTMSTKVENRRGSVDRSRRRMDVQ